jgi:hypothetical protein
VVEGVVKFVAYTEVGEGGWEVIDKLIESVAQTEVSERGGEVGERLVKFSNQVKVCEIGRERSEINGRGEHCINLEMSDIWWIFNIDYGRPL